MMVRGLWVSLLLGGGSMAAAPDHGQCGYGVTITASYVIFEKTRVPTGGIPYACALVRRDTVTGLVEVEHHVFNAMEDVTRLFFKPRIGLIWRTNAHLIGATKHDYLFAADNSGSPCTRRGSTTSIRAPSHAAPPGSAFRHVQGAGRLNSSGRTPPSALHTMFR
ncbi:hypothetical protein ACFSC4_09970 [Deinococcus malanensis]|uniref:hypothetical protein n=1 Tax=Deinococcus malanensis TaxID=1706855 RepID=UPI0036294C6A